jgi:hypothetical protein
MRVFSYLAILLGLFLIGDTIYDEYRGVASASSPSDIPTDYVILRAIDPVQFRNLMIYQWLCAGIVFSIGIIGLGMCRRADRLDPFSVDRLDDYNAAPAEKQKHSGS